MTEFIRALAAGQRPRPRALIAPLLWIALFCGVGLAVRTMARTNPSLPTRTIVLVAKNMAYYIPGQEALNPRLQVERGELVRFVLRNEDPGMSHDLSLPSLGEGSRLLREAATTAEFVVQMPNEPGEHEYLCTLHSLIMRGTLEVR